MLKAYSFCELDNTETKLYNDNFFVEEKSIVRQFVSEHPQLVQMKTEHRRCPICGSDLVSYFYVKWGVPYMRCKKCYSIFAECKNETIEIYNENEKLINFRSSAEYQNNATAMRKEEWQEFIRWVEIRSFRYLHTNRNFKFVDFGNRHKGFIQMIKKSQLCEEYFLKDSILQESTKNTVTDADIALYLNGMQKENEPESKLHKIRNTMKKDGLLILQTRAGSGFDILTLKDKNEKIFPYEHIMLPTVRGLVHLLHNVGFRVLEITTPGVMDIQYAKKNIDKVDEMETFVRYLLECGDSTALKEFQKFLQKNEFSSFVQVIAQKENE